MRKLANWAAYFFIVTTFILTIISVAGIWKILSEDVIWKSFQSIGLVAIACFVVILAEGFSTNKPSEEEVTEFKDTVLIFEAIRKFAGAVLIISVSLCVFLGLLSIWEVMSSDVLYKSLSSLASIGFFSLITMITCKDREMKLKKAPEKEASSQATNVTPPAPLSSN